MAALAGAHCTAALHATLAPLPPLVMRHEDSLVPETSEGYLDLFIAEPLAVLVGLHDLSAIRSKLLVDLLDLLVLLADPQCDLISLSLQTSDLLLGASDGQLVLNTPQLRGPAAPKPAGAHQHQKTGEEEGAPPLHPLPRLLHAGRAATMKSLSFWCSIVEN